MDPTLQFVWGEYRAWAETSRALKAQMTRTGIAVLVLTLLGTALGTLPPVFDIAATSDAARWLPLAAAALLAIATYLTTQLLGDGDRQNWVKTRAVAEALKSEAYKYAVGAPPYDGPDKAQLLAEKVKEAQRNVPGVVTKPPSAAEVQDGIPSPGWSVTDYMTKRNDHQIHFYRKAVSRHASSVRLAKLMSIVFGLAAVVLSASGSTFGDRPAAFLGVITTAAAAIGAWFQGGHHQQLASTYQATLSKLGLLRARYQSGSITDMQFVSEAEAIFEAEHAAWLGEWQTPRTPSAAILAVPPVARPAQVDPAKP